MKTAVLALVLQTALLLVLAPLVSGMHQELEGEIAEPPWRARLAAVCSISLNFCARTW
jgi:hypothetical protein